MLSFITSYTLVFLILIEFSYGQSPGWLKSTIDKFRGQICPNDEDTNNSLVAYVPEGIDILREVLPQICQHLNINDLCSIRSVCKTLKDAADWEISTRKIDIRILPIIEHLERNPSEELKNILKIKPKIAIFFTSQAEPRRAFYDSLSRTLIAQYAFQLPCGCPLLHVMGPSIQFNKRAINGNEALGLFYHESKIITIRNSALYNLNIGSGYALFYDPIERFIEDTFPKNWKDRGMENFAYIVFHVRLPIYEDGEESYSPFVMNRILKRYSSVKFAIWGGNVLSLASNFFDINFFTTSFGMSISGPGVKSWSLVINLDETELEITKKIIGFKEAINSKSKKTVVLEMFTPSLIKGNPVNERKVGIFEEVMGKLKTVSYGVNENEIKYCVDSTKNYEKPQISRENLQYKDNYICYMIMQYL